MALMTILLVYCTTTLVMVSSLLATPIGLNTTQPSVGVAPCNAQLALITPPPILMQPDINIAQLLQEEIERLTNFFSHAHRFPTSGLGSASKIAPAPVPNLPVPVAAGKRIPVMIDNVESPAWGMGIANQFVNRWQSFMAGRRKRQAVSAVASALHRMLSLLTDNLVNLGFNQVGVSEDCRELSVCETARFVVSNTPTFVYQFGMDKLMQLPASYNMVDPYIDPWLNGLASNDFVNCTERYFCDQNEPAAETVATTEEIPLATLAPQAGMRSASPLDNVQSALGQALESASNSSLSALLPNFIG